MKNNVHWEVVTGSVAYGMSGDASDMDIYGFCIPPKTVVFPHLNGEILGFGRPKERFEQFQQHHIEDKEERKEYDMTIYNIVKYFSLLMENNPNMIDSIFVPRRCVLFSTPIGEHVRENRKIFLHKGSYHKFRGYSMAQMSAIKGKRNSSNPKRSALIEKFGYDTKFGSHVVNISSI